MGDKFNAVSEKVGKARVERQERKDRTLVDKYKSPQTQIIRVLGRKKREEVIIKEIIIKISEQKDIDWKDSPITSYNKWKKKSRPRYIIVKFQNTLDKDFKSFEDQKKGSKSEDKESESTGLFNSNIGSLKTGEQHL